MRFLASGERKFGTIKLPSAIVSEQAASFEDGLTADFRKKNVYILVFERKPSTQHHIEDDPDTPDVNLRPRIDTTSDDFWGSIVWAAATRGQEITVRDFVGQSKIGNLDIEIIVEENVFRLEITMDDFKPVRILDAGDDLLEKLASACFGHLAMLYDVVEQLATGVLENKDNVRWGGNNFVAGMH